jgi:hypothetical protein
VNAAEARANLFRERAERRGAEHACALDFLVFGDDEERGPHAARCIHGPGDACSRDYELPHDSDPLPVLYAGTGIGALYGLGMTPHHAAQLAGWNVRRETRS